MMIRSPALACIDRSFQPDAFSALRGPCPVLCRAVATLPFGPGRQQGISPLPPLDREPEYGRVSDLSVRESHVRETHVYVLFFTADKVFKVKKPVRFDFLDLTEPAQRRLACEESQP